MVHHLNFYTSHNQFYIFDKGSEGDTASDNFWTAEAFDDRLAIEDGVLGVSTECYGPIKGELELVDTKNTSLDLSDFDHVVEGGLVVKSGIIQILYCPTSAV